MVATRQQRVPEILDSTPEQLVARFQDNEKRGRRCQLQRWQGTECVLGSMYRA